MTKTTKNEAKEVKIVLVDKNDDDKTLFNLMEKYNIKTFVPLSKVVNCKPQILYSKKNHKTNEYYYNRIATYLLETYKINFGKEITIEALVIDAAKLIEEKEANRKTKQTKNNVEKILKLYEKIENMKKDLDDHEIEVLEKTLKLKEILS